MNVSAVSRWDPLPRYAVGIATIAVAAVLQSLLYRLAGDSVGFMLFHPALVLIAVYCGRGPALLALLLSATSTAINLDLLDRSFALEGGQYAFLIYIVVGALIIFVTSALRRATERAHAAEQRLRVIQDGAGVGLWEIDLRRQLFIGSRSLWRLLDRNGPDTPTPLTEWRSVLAEDELTRFRETLDAQIAARNRAFQHEFAAPLPSGQKRSFLSSINIEYAEDGQPTFLRAAIVDVTSRKRLEAEQQRSLQELRDMDRRRTEFLAMLAHELRNPLAPIRHAVSLAQAARADADHVRWSLDVIDRQVVHMARLLDDLLEASRISRGALELRPEPVELSAVLAVATETARPLFESKQHALDCRLPETAVWLQGDPVRLAQIFSNLLTNAAKYTPPGGVIRVTADTTNDHVAVAVRDDGIGIAPETLPRVFEMFTQAETARNYAEGGMGIGLALVRGLVQLHGGSITAYSRGLNQGSEFVVRLPRIAAPAATSIDSTPATEEIMPRRILIADDNRDAADSLAMLLQLAGHDVLVAYDGETALQLCADRLPAVALLDIGMPEFDGYELARRIRAQSWGRQIRLIAVTGWGQHADRLRALDAGFDAHLTKPVALEQLTAVVVGGSEQTAAA